MSENLSNGAQTTLNGAMNNSQTTGTLTSASGWPEAPFRALITGEGGNTDEIIYVGARSGTGLSTITRAAEPIADGTQVAQAHSSGATITQVLTRAGLINQGLNSGTIGAKAYNNAQQVITSLGVDTPFVFDSEEFDSDGFHSTSVNTSRMTIPAGLGGKYLLIGFMYASSSLSTDTRFSVNGGTLTTDVNFSAHAGNGYTWSTVLSLNGGDYVEMYYNGATGTLGHASAPEAKCSFTIIKLDSGKVGSGVGAKAYNSAGQSLNDVVIPLDSEEFDTDGFHSTSSNTSRMTIPAGLAGKYALFGGSFINGAGRLLFQKNGSTQVRSTGGSISAGGYTTISAVVDAVAGDYFEILGAAGTTRTYGDGSEIGAQTSFSIMRLDSLPASSPSSVRVGARVYHSTTQNPGGSYVALAMDSESYDTDSFHSTVTNNSRLTVPSSGLYLITLASPNAPVNNFIGIRKNGTTYLGFQSSQGAPSMSIVADLTAGDYVEAVASVNGNIEITVDTGFSITKLTT